MTKAGVDFGSSLVKAVWVENGFKQYFSTADCSLKKIAYSMAQADVTQINVAGIGYSPERVQEFVSYGMKVKSFEGDAILNEIQSQAHGARQLLEEHIDNFLLVSIGTGTSYTSINGENTTKFPLGNSLGGGFLHGLGQVLGIQDYTKIAATNEASLDLCIKDMIPEKVGSFEGEMAIANLGKGKINSEKSSALASAVNIIASTTIKDIMLYGMIPHFQVPNDVVYIGSTISHTPLLKNLLQAYTLAIGKTPHFPKRGEFALALGAMISED